MELLPIGMAGRFPELKRLVNYGTF
jgi:hypothetical protein